MATLSSAVAAAGKASSFSDSRSFPACAWLLLLCCRFPLLVLLTTESAGFGRYTQMQVTCNECSGKGTQIRRYALTCFFRFEARLFAD